MSNQDLPVGKRFSHVYIERGVPQKDSERFRRRLGAFFRERLFGRRDDIAIMLSREIGLVVPYRTNYGYDISRLFLNAELRDVLDSITEVWFFLSSDWAIQSQNLAEDWKNFVERVFLEENLGYRLDEECGVHYFVDEEFERNRISALSCLAEVKYAAVRAEFEKAHSKLDLDPAQTKEAVRAIFESLEILSKLIFEDIPRLNSFVVQSKIKPLAQEFYKGDSTAIKAAEKMLDSLCDWIEACHLYRHGQKVEEPNDPPLGLAVELVSTGASYLRWLVELSNK